MTKRLPRMIGAALVTTGGCVLTGLASLAYAGGGAFGYAAGNAQTLGYSVVAIGAAMLVADWAATWWPEYREPLVRPLGRKK